MLPTNIISLVLAFITLLPFVPTTLSQPSDNVTDLIYTYQHKYCGSHFCKVHPSYKPPLCPPSVSFDTNTSSTDEQIRRQEKPPCIKCSCNDNCVIYGDCCADIHSGGQYAQYYFDCYMIFMHIPEGYRTEYSYVVTKCLSNAPNYNKELAEKCENGMLGYIQDGRVVMAPHPFHTNVNFRNKYCAMCYGVTDFTPWDVYVTCKEEFSSSNYTDINSLIRSADKSDGCVVTTAFQNGTLDVSKDCLNAKDMISVCNVTGDWKKYNKSIETACQTYLNPTLKYRNIFCALCNGIPEESLRCPGAIGAPYIPGVVVPFSAILNFDNSDIEVIKGGSQAYPVTRIGQQEKHQCRDGDVFDQVSKKCREKYCPLIHSRDGNNCTQAVSSEDHVVTAWTLIAYFVDSVIIPYGRFQNVGNLVVQSINDLVEDLGFSIHDSSYRDYASVYSHNELLIKESHLEIKLSILPKYKLEISRQKLKNITNIATNITYQRRPIFLNVVPVEKVRVITDMLLVDAPLVRGYIPNRYDLHSIIEVPINFNLSCPMFRFESHEVFTVNDSIKIHEIITLEYQEYSINKRKDYFICIDNVFPLPADMFSSEPTKPIVDSVAEQIITSVCLSCSLLFLMLTMLVYMVVKELHTVPGLNLILLASSLFAAQALYLFGAGAVTNQTVCIVLGALIHYFWLVSFAWMNVCCLHMFRVFTNLFNSLNFASSKTSLLLKYSTFAYGVPLVIVAITVSTSLLTSNYSSFGYGGSKLCFVTSGLVSIVFFGIPTGITVLINAVLLVYTVISLKRINIDPSGNKQSGASDITKFFKLSTITGLSWLFGFLGYFLQRAELMYVFTVLTTGQGVFIFLSFVASRRVVKLFGDRIPCIRKRKNNHNQYSYSTAGPRHTTPNSTASDCITSHL